MPDLNQLLTSCPLRTPPPSWPEVQTAITSLDGSYSDTFTLEPDGAVAPGRYLMIAGRRHAYAITMYMAGSPCIRFVDPHCTDSDLVVISWSRGGLLGD